MYPVSPKIGIGLIGTGNIGSVHLTGFLALKEANLLDIEIAAICDIDAESLKTAVELFEPLKTYDNYEDLVNDANVDIVYVCTPTYQHSDMVKASINANKPVLCEKPLAHSCPQARELMMVSQTAQVKTGVGLVLRYDQFLLYAKHLVDTKDFGRPILAHIRDDQRFPVDYSYYSKWRGDKSIAGGGTLIEHSIHDIDVFSWFFGEIESVYAKVGFVAEREVEDHASLVMTHKNGVVSTLDSIWHWVERPNERRIEFFFEKGFIGITLESGNRFLEYHMQDEDPVRINEETANNVLLETLDLHAKNLSPDAYEALTSVGGERYAAMSYAFLKTIEIGGVPKPDFMDAVAAHKIVDAAYESAVENRPVNPL